MTIRDAICYVDIMDRFICSKHDFQWVKARLLVLSLLGKIIVHIVNLYPNIAILVSPLFHVGLMHILVTFVHVGWQGDNHEQNKLLQLITPMNNFLVKESMKLIEIL